MVTTQIYDDAQRPDERLNLIAENVPKPPFSVILVGSSRCGKTTIFKNFLLNDEYGYNKYFDQIIMFMGNKQDKHSIQRLVANYDRPVTKKIEAHRKKLYREYEEDEADELFEEYYETMKDELLRSKLLFFERYDDAVVNDIIDEAEDLVDEALADGDEVMPRILMVFDDQMTYGLSSANKMNAMDTLFAKGRHCGISTIVMTQKYSKLNQNLRQENVTNLFVFHGMSQQQVKQIAEDHAMAGLSNKQVVDLINSGIKKKYAKVIIDKQSKDINDTYRDTDYKPIDISSMKNEA